MREWREYIAARLRGTGHDPDPSILEELAQHATAAYEASRAEGLDAPQARARVETLVGAWAADAARLRRSPRHEPAVVPPPATPSSSFTGVAHDVRYAGRLFRRQPRFAALVALTIALGIAATTSLFSVTYGVLMKPLPWPEANRIVVLKETRGGHHPRFSSFSNAAYLAWRGQSQTLEAIAAWAPRTVTLAGAGDPERIRAATATAGLFAVLKVRPLVGSFFTTEDEAAGGVVVLSEGLWRQRFGGDPGVLGRSLQLDGKTHRIVGVLASDAAFPDAETRAWIPLAVAESKNGLMSLFEAVARLQPGVTPAQAAAEGTSRGLSRATSANLSMVIGAIFGGDGPIEVHATPIRDSLTADVRQPLMVLLAAVVLLFATAIANVAGLQLAQATTRRREMAIRAALGAGTSRVTRQLLIESLLLALCGGAAGLLLTALVHLLLPSLLPAGFPRIQDLSVDLPVAGFAVALSLAAALAVGLLPAFRLRRMNLVESLTEDGTAPTGARGRTATARVRLVIMAGQVAIACVLLVGASLLGRSFLALLHADLGLDPTNVLTARVQMPAFAYTPERRAELSAAILARVRTVPGVTAATFADAPPFATAGGTSFTMDGRQVRAGIRTVTPGYFAAVGMRLSSGRDFTDDDVAASQPVFVVNEAFARQYLGPDPVGRRVRAWVRTGPRTGSPENNPQALWEVIGIVRDVRHRGARESAEPEVYQYREKGDPRFTTAPAFLIRTSGDAAALAPTLRAIVRQEDPSLILDGLATMEERLLTGLAQPRLYAVLLGGFALLAVLIAGVGLLGVLSYSVAQRSRELAVRAALGARPGQLVALVLRQGLMVAAAGLLVGIPASMILTAAIARLLYGVTRYDTVTFFAVPLVLLIAAAVAAVPPAVRAARLDPLRVLRAG